MFENILCDDHRNISLLSIAAAPANATRNYYIFESATNWVAAYNFCKINKNPAGSGKTMRLATLVSKAQQTAVLENLTSLGFTGKYWVDGMRNVDHMRWEFVSTGNAYSYLLNYLTGYPVEIGDFLAFGRVGSNTGVSNQDWTVKLPFICQSN